MSGAADQATIAAQARHIEQLQKLLRDRDEADRKTLMAREVAAVTQREAEMVERDKALAEERRTKAAESLEAQRISIWKSHLITNAGEAGLSPHVIFSETWLSEELAKVPADSWPPSVQPSDFPEYQDMQDIAPTLFASEEEPAMLKAAREAETKAAAMAAVKE